MRQNVLDAFLALRDQPDCAQCQDKSQQRQRSRDSFGQCSDDHRQCSRQQSRDRGGDAHLALGHGRVEQKDSGGSQSASQQGVDPGFEIGKLARDSQHQCDQQNEPDRFTV